MVKKDSKSQNSEPVALTLNMDQIGTTVYEKARIIGARALQLSQGATPKVDLTPEEMEHMKFNPIEIAKKEYEADVIPIAVKRV